MAYIKEHHIVTEGEYLEYYVVDNVTAEGIEDYVTEISVKIKSQTKEERDHYGNIK